MVKEFIEMYLLAREADKWLVEKVPSELRTGVFDNPFVDTLYASNALLLRLVLQRREQRDFWNYILNEWQPGDNGFNTIEEIVIHMLEEI